MSIREIKVTERNWGELNRVSDSWDCKWDLTLALMMDLNAMLDEELKGGNDWGGEYSTWLDAMGIHSNSDNGWWSREAINPENLECFIEAMSDETSGGLFDKCQEVIRAVKVMSKVGAFKANTGSVRVLIERFNA